MGKKSREKKDRDKKGEGSVSSNSESEMEVPILKTPDKEKESPGEDGVAPLPPTQSPHLVSPELSQRMSSIEQNQARMEKSLLEQFSLLREERRERSASSKRKREGGNDSRSGSKVGRRANMSASQQPQGNVNANIIPQYFSQVPAQAGERPGRDNPPPITRQNPPTRTFLSQQHSTSNTVTHTPLSQPNVVISTGVSGPPTDSNQTPPQTCWDIRPPHITPDVASPPPPPPLIDSEYIRSTIESLKFTCEDSISEGNRANIDSQYLGNIAKIFDGVFDLLGDLVSAVEKIPTFVKRSSTNLIPNQSVLKQLVKLDVPEVHRTIQSVKSNDREKELEKCSRSVRLFNAINHGDENAYKTIERAFQDQPKFTNPLKDSKAFFLGNPKLNKTIPIVIEFQSESHKTEFMSAIRDENAVNDSGVKYSASIHWPKDLSLRIKGWKEKLYANPDNHDKQFYFSYRKNSKMIKIAQCKKNAAVRTWLPFSSFPIPAKEAKAKFKGLPECLGGDPPVTVIPASSVLGSVPSANCEVTEVETVPMEQ